MTLSPLGDTAVVAELGQGMSETTLGRVRALAASLSRDPPAGVVDVVPAFGSVTVFYDPMRIGSFALLCEELKTRATRSAASSRTPHPAHVVEIPVCYGGEFGPDLLEVAARADVRAADVIAMHSGAEYEVHAIGFAPGFPYLGGLSNRLHTPRRATPRALVPAGTVGIGGAQTGIYSLATPGGWNLIGRTPRLLFNPARHPPALLRAGDRVKFRPISPEEFAAWK